MSLLLLFHGAAAAAAAPSTGWRSQFQTIVRRAGLTAAVVATLQPVYVEQPPEVAAQYGVWTQRTDYSPAQRSVALLGQVSTWPAQVPAVVPSPDFDFFHRWQAPHIYRNNRNRTVDLLGDVSANGWLRPQPEFDFFTRWQQPHIQRRKPYYENLGDTTVWSAQPPPAVVVTYPPIDLPWQQPLVSARRSGELLGEVVWQARVADVQYQDGWRSQFSEPPKPAQRSYGLLGWTVGSPQAAPPFFQVYQEGWRQELSKPVKLQPQPRQEGFIVSGRVPDVEYQDGWRSRFTDPPANLQARRAVELLTGWDWPGYGYFFQGVVLTPAELAHIRWTDPPAYSKAKPRLEGQVSWPGYGYSFAAVVPTPTELWWTRWQDPPKAPARSVTLLGEIVWPAQVPTTAATYGIVDLQDRYDPARRSVSLLGQVSTWPAQVPPVVVVTYQEGWRGAFSEPVRTALPRLEGRITWGPRVPDREYQDGWRNLWQGPPAYLGPRRATNLLESWDWPGYGYFFQAVVQTPSELWWTRWQDPTKPPPRSVGLLGQPIWPPQVPTVEVVAQYDVWTQTDLYSPAKRSAALLGQISTWSPRVPDREFQEGWRSKFQEPAIYSRSRPRLQGQISFAPQAPPTPVAPPSDWWARQWPNPTLAARRSVGLLGNISYAVYPFVQAQVVYQEGWRSAYLQPLKIWQPWRLQGFVSFAGVQGLPAATPSALWMPSWQQWPRERLRSIYLRQGSWAGWDPQFIIQITPPTPLEGVTFTFGLKRGASVSPGTKEGATMTGQRKVGGATLITRVKPRNS